MSTPITTGAARIVWGNPLTGKPKTDQNNRPILDDQGKQIMQWAFGIAIPKAEFGAIWQAMNTEAMTLYPQGVPQNYAWKFKDGDGLDDQGKPFNTREGYTGNIVLTVSTESFAPRVVRLNGGAYSDMLDGIKTGDYVRVAINLKAHSGKAGTRGSVPGLYVNPVMVEFLGYGEAIQNGPDAMAVFGGQQMALPPGASQVPLAPAGAMPGAPGAPQPGFTAPGQFMPQPGTPMAHAPAAGHPGTPVASFQTPQGQTAFHSSQPAPGQPQYAAPAFQGAPAAPAVPAHDFVHRAAPGMAPQPGFAPMPGQPTR